MVGQAGIFVVIDGIDGAGKTTQVQLLREALQAVGETVVQSKEPTHGPWGQLVRRSATNGRLSLEDELNAFIADRKEHVAGTIQPGLDRGEIVIVDRYFYSTIAYQGARGADPERLSQRMREMFPVPDVAIFLDADPGITLHRIAHGRQETPNEFEQLDGLRHVRKVFQRLAVISPETRVIDASRDIPSVHAEIVSTLVNGVLKAKRCAKNYDCDALYCAYRMAGECHWANVGPQLIANSRAPSAVVR